MAPLGGESSDVGDGERWNLTLDTGCPQSQGALLAQAREIMFQEVAFMWVKCKDAGAISIFYELGGIMC